MHSLGAVTRQTRAAPFSWREQIIILEAPSFYLSSSPPSWLWKQYFKNDKSVDVRGLPISHINLACFHTPPVSEGRDLQWLHNFRNWEPRWIKNDNEYSISCEATWCWFGANNQRAVFASECSSVYGQRSMSPSWILNAYQRWWQARGQEAAQVAAVLCSIRPQRSTEPLTATPKIQHYLHRALCVPLYGTISLHYIQPQTAETGATVCADWLPPLTGLIKSMPGIKTSWNKIKLCQSVTWKYPDSICFINKKLCRKITGDNLISC